MSQGELKKTESGTIWGEIRTRDICEKISLIANTDMQKDNAPSHIVQAKSPKGHMYQAGIAYAHEIKQGRMLGQLKFLILLNDPSFGEKSVAFDAWPLAGGNGWDVVFAKEREEQREAA